jgi:CHAT domain-containing protein
LIRALEAIEVATIVGPGCREVLFNRALILERIGLDDAARVAWSFYLAHDRGSGWSREAAEHLARLQAPTSEQRWLLQLGNLHAAALRQDRATVRRIVAILPQAAREYASEQLLEQWGKAVLERRMEEAHRCLAVAGSIGSALAELTGERTVSDGVLALEDAARRAENASTLTGLAQAQISYHAGSTQFRRLEIEDSAPLLAAAEKPLVRAGSPLALWAATALAGVRLYRGDLTAAAAVSQEILVHADIRRYPALAARAHWALGLTRARQGRFGDALRHYKAAAIGFAAASERENLGAVEGLSAESFDFLGLHDEAWRQRYRALHDLHDFRDSLRLHTLLRDAADSALRGGMARAALVLQDQGLAVARRFGQLRMIAEALLWRSKIEISLHRFTAAAADLQAARADNLRGGAGALAERLAMDALLADGEAERQARHFDAAVRKLKQVIAYYKRGPYALDLAVAYAALAQAELGANRTDAAEADFESAIELFERQRETVGERRLLFSYSEAAQTLFDQMISLQVDRRRRPDRALAFAERGRSLTAAQTLPADVSRGAAVTPVFDPLGQLVSIPADAAVIEYFLVGDRLLIWTLRRSRLDFWDHQVNGQELMARIEAFGDALRARLPGLRDSSLAQDLWKDLIPPAVRELPQQVKLVLVPDKILNAVPFGALVCPATHRYLIEDHELNFVQSFHETLGRWSLHRHDQPPGQVLLVGNPAFDRGTFPSLEDLPAAGAEVTAIAALYPGAHVLRGRTATRGALVTWLRACQVFHFAGHAVFNPLDPESSFLLLAPSNDRFPDGVFLARDLAQLRLPGLRLVVLSACNTLGPEASRTAGISGVAGVLLGAGATAVVGTLWRIDDHDAARLLPIFHRGFRETSDAAIALRSAQLALLDDTDSAYRSPAAWAPFQVYGLSGSRQE